MRKDLNPHDRYFRLHNQSAASNFFEQLSTSASLAENVPYESDPYTHIHAEKMGSLAESSIRFDMGDIDDWHFDNDTFQFIIKNHCPERVFLPHDPCLLSFYATDTSNGEPIRLAYNFLLHVEDEKLVAHLAMTYSEPIPSMPNRARIKLIATYFLPTFYDEQPHEAEGIEVLHHPIDASWESGKTIFAMAFGMLVMINAGYTSEKTTYTQRRKMRARKNSGGTISRTIILQKEKIKKIYIPKGGTHACPRWHTRRAHSRTLGDGRVIYVRGSEVGSKKDGEVHKDYAIAKKPHMPDTETSREARTKTNILLKYFRKLKEIKLYALFASGRR